MSNKHCFSHLVPYDISSPEFLKRLQCEDAVEGERATLSCQVVGDPGKFLFLPSSSSFSWKHHIVQGGNVARVINLYPAVNVITLNYVRKHFRNDGYLLLNKLSAYSFLTFRIFYRLLNEFVKRTNCDWQISVFVLLKLNTT